MYKWIFSERLKLSVDEHRRIASGRVFQKFGLASSAEFASGGGFGSAEFLFGGGD